MAFLVEALLDAAMMSLIPRKAVFALLVLMMVVCGTAIVMNMMDGPSL